jgi:hypothetical protein
MANNKLKHFHLVAGTILFHDPEANATTSIMLNCTIVTDEKNIPSKEIGRAQQTLQMLMFKKLDDPKVEVMDVVIVGISYLGHMTDEYFLAPPEGTTRQEVDRPGVQH